MTMEHYADGTGLGDAPARLEPPPSRLLNREGDLAAIHSLLLADEVRLLTLTGPGGVGKTRLAMEIGGQVRSRFAHGVVLVDLTPIRHAANVLLVVGEHFGFRDLDGALLHERLQGYLAQRELLLILDNVEHVLPEVTRLAGLLAAAPHIKLLTTSRESLHLRWEQVYSVPPWNSPIPSIFLRWRSWHRFPPSDSFYSGPERSLRPLSSVRRMPRRWLSSWSISTACPWLSSLLPLARRFCLPR